MRSSLPHPARWPISIGMFMIIVFVLVLVPTALPTAAAGSLSIQYRASDLQSSNDSSVQPRIQVVNAGGDVALSSLTIRYWYTLDAGATTQAYHCDWATIGCAVITGRFVQLSSPTTNASHYLELGFTSGAGTLKANSTSGEILARFNKTDWSNFTESNDYSYNSSATDYTTWTRITLYQNGILVWGTEPTGTTPSTSAPTSAPTSTATRVPTSLPTSAPTTAPSATATPRPTSTPSPAPAGSWVDNLDTFDTGRWAKADGWTNGSMFNVGWRADHVTFANGQMTLRLDNVGCPGGCSGKPYASGEYRTNIKYGYGSYTVRMKAAKGSGLVSGFFTYTGASEGDPWDEIDVEFLGKDTTRFQANYFTNGTGNHETMISLGFDASLAFHTYTIEWTAGAIRWYVDGALVHTENGSRGPLPSHPGKFMANFWPSIGVDGWTGPFTYPGTPINAVYDSMAFTPIQ
jgi:endo-1,3-1,4-beta-glycanase ExoK